MSKKLSNWASIAEIFASLAVVLTLVILIFGVRENTEVVRAGSFDDLLGDVNELALSIAANERLTGIFRRYMNGESGDLTEDERFTLLILLRTAFRSLEKAYFAYQYGTVGRNEYSRFDEQACRDFARAGTDLWREINTVLTAEYAEYVESMCAASMSSAE
jgi:hypothetical protein